MSQPFMPDALDDIDRAVARLTARCDELIELSSTLHADVIAANRRAADADRKLDASLIANAELRSQLNAERALRLP